MVAYPRRRVGGIIQVRIFFEHVTEFVTGGADAHRGISNVGHLIVQNIRRRARRPDGNTGGHGAGKRPQPLGRHTGIGTCKQQARGDHVIERVLRQRGKVKGRGFQERHRIGGHQVAGGTVIAQNRVGRIVGVTVIVARMLQRENGGDQLRQHQKTVGLIGIIVTDRTDIPVVGVTNFIAHPDHLRLGRGKDDRIHGRSARIIGKLHQNHQTHLGVHRRPAGRRENRRTCGAGRGRGRALAVTTAPYRLNLCGPVSRPVRGDFLNVFLAQRRDACCGLAQMGRQPPRRRMIGRDAGGHQRMTIRPGCRVIVSFVCCVKNNGVPIGGDGAGVKLVAQHPQ